MNKKIKTVINIVLLVLLIVTSIYTIIHYFFNYSKTDWFASSGNGYTVIGKEIGMPSWGGTSKALIEVYDTAEKTNIDNNNEFLSESNYEVSIKEDHIALKLYNYDGKICGAYRFYYEDFKEEKSWTLKKLINTLFL